MDNQKLICSKQKKALGAVIIDRGTDMLVHISLLGVSIETMKKE